MTSDDVVNLFEELDDEYLEVERVDSPLHPRCDIAALLLVHKIVGGTRDMIVASEHDVIYLDATADSMAEADVTREQILELIRYGVRLGDNGLEMYT